jgi:hypothetical protein
VYDCNARCIDIVSHSKSDLKVVIVGPDLLLSDDDVKMLLGVSDPHMRVLRLPTRKGLLLHRMLMPRPSDWEEIRGKQVSEVRCEVKTLSWDEEGAQGGGAGSSLLQTLYFPATALSVATIARLYFRRSSESVLTSELHVLVAVCLIVGAVMGCVGAAAMVKLLKRPGFIVWTNMMRLQRVGKWNFNVLASGPGGPSHASSTSTWGDPFVHLVFFLHGALGLLPSEVQYGNSISSMDGEREVPLQYGGSYVIEVPALDLDCAWYSIALCICFSDFMVCYYVRWSITLYGSDLYLIPNNEEVYSVNSFQLQALSSCEEETTNEARTQKKTGLLVEKDGNNIAAGSSMPLRIICSPIRPPLKRDDGEVFWLPMPAEDENDIKSSGATPRFVLRGSYDAFVICTSYLHTP